VEIAIQETAMPAHKVSANQVRMPAWGRRRMAVRYSLSTSAVNM
jgi:hypothetical protein